MRFLVVCVVSGTLAGCAGTAQDVRNNLTSRYVGQSVDVLVAEYGPPASTFKMHSGETSHIWQLSNLTNIDTGRYGGTANTVYCKVSVVATSTGTIKSLTTEDASNLLYGSLCARRLGIQRS